MNTRAEEYWKLINDFEDYLEGGMRKPREIPQGLGFPAPGPSPPSEDGIGRISEEVAGCIRCRLSENRTNTVPGEGPPNPLVMCIGEGPGADEDRTGRPFVGRAGRYLDKWLEAVGLDRTTNCYIANIVKCRPPGNRDPLEDEADSCLPFLRRQIALLRPRFILTLGRVASQILTGRSEGIGSLRGETYEFLGVPLIPTYHPSGVLRNPELRAPVWDDLKRLRSLLDAD
jgi:uracil-DNA glycosylase